jgi:(2Fe-2S) ferredoxin
MLGTAFPANRVLLVEQPGPWGPDGLTDSDLDERVAHQLRDRAQDERIRVQLIRRPGRSTGGGERRWALADLRDGRAELRWARFRYDRELLDLPLDGSAGTPDDGAAYLVCTHGRHDACCALRGRPATAALAALRPDRVWETTHVGGDRFAANVLIVPSGHLYGRLEPADAPALVEAVESGAVLFDRLRGRAGLAPAAQAALAFAARELQASGLRVHSVAPTVDGRTTVRLTGPDSGELTVAVQIETRTAAGLICRNPRPARFLAYAPSWPDG